MSTLVAQNISNGTVSTSSANVINGSAKAWVNFNGTGTVAIRASYNVLSITDGGTGFYTVTMINAMPDINYCIAGSASTNSGAAMIFCTNSNNTTYQPTAPTTSAFTVLTTNNSTAFDSTYINAAVFR
jgi:hypothetical protein